MNRWRWIGFLVLMALLMAASPTLAHEISEGAEEHGPQNWHELAEAWPWEPVSWAGLGIMAALYGVGLFRLWRAAGTGHGIRRWEAGCFAAGWVTLAAALVSPLHSWGSVLFSAHMTQHELLMLVAAPLIVLGRPMIPFLHALPRQAARDLGAIANIPTWQAIWSTITHPFAAWAVHAIVLWGWHAPALFQATLHNDWVHAAQHTSFLLAALLFWWSLFHARNNAAASGAAVLYLFTTALHSGFLGAMLTFARGVWYPAYDDTAAWGMTQLEDQQLGGLIMWVPACAVYLVAALFVMINWLRIGERTVRQRETAELARSAS